MDIISKSLIQLCNALYRKCGNRRVQIGNKRQKLFYSNTYLQRHENLIYLVETIAISKRQLFRSDLYAILRAHRASWRVYSASSSGLCQLGSPERQWTRVGAASRPRERKRGPPYSLVRIVRERPTLSSLSEQVLFCPSLSLSLSFIFSTVPHTYGFRHQHSLSQGRPYLPFLSVTLGDIKPRVASREIHLQGRSSRGITRNISSF